jgi:hypothetical protein
MPKTIIALAIASGLLVVLPGGAMAKVCKEPLADHATTRIAGDQAMREKRATENAVARWRDQARWKYGLLYRFWSPAEDKKTECKSTPRQSTCTVTATPCRLV